LPQTSPGSPWTVEEKDSVIQKIDFIQNRLEYSRQKYTEFSDETDKKLIAVESSLNNCYKFLDTLKNDTINDQFKLIIDLLVPLVDLSDLWRIEEKYISSKK